MDSDEPVPVARVRVMQIITLAMAMGILFFLALAVAITLRRDDAPAEPLLFPLAVVVLVSNLGLAVAVPHLTVRAGLHRLAQLPSDTDADRRTAVEHLLNLRQTSLLIANALLEGAAFLAGIALLVEGNWYALGLMAAALLLILFRFPTVDGVRAWLERQQSTLQDMRHEQARSADPE